MIPWLIVSFVVGFAAGFFVMGRIAVKKAKEDDKTIADLQDMHLKLLIELLKKAVVKEAAPPKETPGVN